MNISFIISFVIGVQLVTSLAIDKNFKYINLNKMVQRLQEYAPLKTATSWDNVGLLVEPSGNFLVKKILVANDLLESVLDEAISKKVDMIISYHPPMTGYPPYTNLKPLTHLTQNTWKQKTLVKCIENRIAIYSPHTTWDSIDGGINDWILSVFNTSKIEPIKKNRDLVTFSGYSKSVKVEIKGSLTDIMAKLNVKTSDLKLIQVKSIKNAEKSNVTELEFMATDNGVLNLVDLIKDFYTTDSQSASKIIGSIRMYELDKPLMKNVGLGRIGYLQKPIKINEIIKKMKKLLNQKTFRLALGNGKSLDDEVSVLAIGAGSGTGLLNNTIADFIVTGELTHHDILHETHRGNSILITDHSNTERGFIYVFKKKFLDLLAENSEKVEIIASENDRDPIEYV